MVGRFVGIRFATCLIWWEGTCQVIKQVGILHVEVGHIVVPWLRNIGPYALGSCCSMDLIGLEAVGGPGLR